MPYPLCAYVNIFFLFLGSALGCVACIACGKILGRRFYRFRLSLFFLLLSAAFVFAILFLLNLKAFDKGALFLYARENLVIFLFYFMIGFLCSAFLKIFFPLALILYTALTFLCALALYGKMRLPQKYSLAVDGSFVRDEESGERFQFAESGAYADTAGAGAFKADDKNEGAPLCFLVLTVYETDDNLLLPLPHIWYKLSGAVAGNAAGNNAAGRADNAADAGSLAAVPLLEDALFMPEEGGHLKRIQNALCRRILKEPRAQLVPVKKQAVYPCLFELRLKASGAALETELHRVM